MSTLGALLAAAAGPLAKRAAAALGFGLVTYVGFDQAVGSVLTDAKLSWTGMSPELQALMAIAGVNSGLAIIAGAITARLALMALKKFTLL